ncbi:MAG: aldose 1-epimerase family protein [Lactobacillaceae bacterium]|nr:aldose 1-epimerase family protein [Lactobacillaceae bacterium]
MAILIENGSIQVKINELGAELTSVVNQATGIEYIWQGDPKIWGRHAPNLFPIVGRLHGDTYRYAGKDYHLTQHGFARDSEFEVIEQSETAVRLRLTDSKETRQIYPFKFQFDVVFSLDTEDSLEVQYVVTNLDQKELYFSVGGHPGINLPLQAGQTFNDYLVNITPAKEFGRKVLSGPFVDFAKDTTFDASVALPVRRSDYQNDAIILELKQEPISIEVTDQKHEHGVMVDIQNAQYAGIWTKADVEAPFLCVEPWWGIADTVDASGDLTDKLGINHLQPTETMQGIYALTFF